MPSKESEALADLFQHMADRMAANPDMDIDSLRALLEQLHTAAAEPTEVTYEEMEAGGRPAMLAKPNGGALDRVILYTHGGGFVTNSRHSHRKLAGHLAKAAGCLALLVEYRLAPEHPFPAAVDDCAAAYRWLLARGFRPDCIATAGDSAGGNLATATVLKLKLDGLPLPAATVAFSPWYDIANTGATMQTNAATDRLVQRATADNMAAMYVGGAGGDAAAALLRAPLANPLHADLAGHPPAFLAAGTHETLADNVDRFAERARAAGVEVEVQRQPGQQHVYVFMAGRAPEADETVRNAGLWLRAKLGLAVVVG